VGNGNADGASPYMSIVVDKSRHEVLVLSGWDSILHEDADHLVARSLGSGFTSLGAVPRSMLGNKGVATICGLLGGPRPDPFRAGSPAMLFTRSEGAGGKAIPRCLRIAFTFPKNPLMGMAGSYTGSYLDRSNCRRTVAILADIGQASLVRCIPTIIIPHSSG
jgi:hypothetical protein